MYVQGVLTQSVDKSNKLCRTTPGSIVPSNGGVISSNSINNNIAIKQITQKGAYLQSYKNYNTNFDFYRFSNCYYRVFYSCRK